MYNSNACKSLFFSKNYFRRIKVIQKLKTLMTIFYPKLFFLSEITFVFKALRH